MKITEEQLFENFRGQSDEAEARKIDQWLGEDESNRRLYRQVRAEFELLAMTGDIDAVKGNAKVAGTGNKTIRTVVRIFGGVAAAVVLFFMSSQVTEYRLDKRIRNSPLTVTVPAGQRMTLTLADGTSVNLNSGTRLVYPAVFTGNERCVYIEGEAAFDVTHDEKRPFRVSTYAAQIEVLGTEFNVLADSETNEFSTTLIDGRVKVTGNEDGSRSVSLLSDQKASIKDGRMYVEKANASESVLWTEGILDISDLDFMKLIRKMEKAYGVTIEVEREEIPELHGVQGKLRLFEGVDHALAVISSIADFEYEKDARTGTIYIR